MIVDSSSLTFYVLRIFITYKMKKQNTNKNENEKSCLKEIMKKSGAQDFQYFEIFRLSDMKINIIQRFVHTFLVLFEAF